MSCSGGLLLGAILERKILKDMIGVFVSAIRHLAGEIVVEQQNAFPRLWKAYGFTADYSLSREPFLAMVLV